MIGIVNVVPSLLIFVTLKIDVIRSFEASVVITATQTRVIVDNIRHSQRRENIKSYIALTGWGL
jgi:hypothetical protein